MMDEKQRQDEIEQIAHQMMLGMLEELSDRLFAKYSAMIAHQGGTSCISEGYAGLSMVITDMIDGPEDESELH